MDRRARSRCLRVACAAGLLALCAGSRPALAQPAARPVDAQSAEDRRTALYRAGVEAAAAGRWAEARQHFVAAMAIRASAKVFFSLAQTEEQLGQVASADADYGRALDSARAAGESQVAAAAEHARAPLAPRVPHMRVVVTLASGAATAKLDGQPVAVGTAVAVDPGAHLVVVTAPGMRDVTANVAIGERQQLDVPVQLEAIGSSTAPPRASRTPVDGPASGSASGPDGATAGSMSRAGPWHTVGLVVAAVGVVGLGVGTYFAVDAKSKDDQSNRQGCNGNACPPEAASTRRDALTAADASTVAFVAGGVLAAAGLVLWLTAPSAQAVHVSPVALRGGGGILLTGEWR